MQELKIGFIGVGGVAQPHLSNLTQIEGVKIAAVCDTFADRSTATAATYGATAYTDYREMLQKEQLDGCYVCLIPAVHGDTELDLIKHRVPFYVEKPVHMDLDACQRVLDALEKTPVVSGVGYHWRYTKPSREVREFVAARRPSLFEGWWYGGFVGAPWWRQMALSGGQVVEQSTHIFDLARFLMGEVRSVYAAGTTGAMTDTENYDIHDASIAVMNFDSGAIGQITTGCISGEHGASRTEAFVKGRNWSAWANGADASWSSEEDSKKVESGQTWAEQLGNGDHAFITALRTGDSSGIVSNYRSGAQTLAVTLAVNASLASGQPVDVRRFI